jgi:hypothetical protein
MRKNNQRKILEMGREEKVPFSHDILTAGMLCGCVAW